MAIINRYFMRKIIFTNLLLLIVLFSACKEDLGLLYKYDTVPPSPLSDSEIRVNNIAGGAVIKYKVPNEPDIKAVEARYTISSGKEFRVRSSYLNDSILVEGFLDEIDYSIDLFVIDKSENYSEVKQVMIHPLKSPILQIKETVQMTPDFGGMMIKWENQYENPIGIFVSQVVEDDTILIDSYYSKNKFGEFAIRGLDAVETNFIIQIRDKWHNYSPKHEFVLEPLFETELDYKLFEIMPNIYFNNIPSGTISSMKKLWDNGDIGDYWPGPDKSTVPWYGSIKLGKKVKLSRIVIWQYAWANMSYMHFYAGGNAQEYEIWGSNDPATDGSFDGWTKIMNCKIIKKSGLPLGMGSFDEEDLDIALNRGHEFAVPLEAEAYSHIRLKCISNFSFSEEYGSSSEIKFFGDDRY